MKKMPMLLLVCLLAAILVVLLIVAANLRTEPAPEAASGTTGQSATEVDTQPAAPTTAPTEATIPPTTLPAPTAPEISPDQVGIYIPAEDGTKARILLTEFSAPRTAKRDIDCFEVLASHDERVEGSSFKGIWETAWNAHENAAHTKIGFRIAFDLEDGTRVEKTILKPGDAKEFYDYLEVYLYDDIANAGHWYSHLEDHEITEETVISSIKLTAGSKIAQVGDILLTAFLYTGEDCFDAEGNYIGAVSATILITE